MDEQRKKALKEIIRQLHSGASQQEVKQKFRQILGDVSSVEIAKIEQELVKEGMPREEIQRLCDVHMEVFREQLETQKLNVPAEHPVNILMEEHKIMLRLTEKLKAITNKIQKINDKNYVGEEIHQLEHIAEDFTDSEKHYLREENVLFPSLEKHGITEPPAIMWMDHNQIREKKKQLTKLIETYNSLDFKDFKNQLGETTESLGNLLPSHFYKENSILFPAALRVITADEWKEIRIEFDEIGYCCFIPSSVTGAIQMTKSQWKEKPTTKEGALQFETGTLTKEELEAMLDSLPIDITFVDKDDSVKYFSNAEKRVFVRSKSIIGRKVQLCHPQKSVHIVNHIVEAFKKGKKDVAEFWIPVNNRLIYIRYFAVRNKNGKYLGTMEVTQDLTDIKKIEGQRRLLDWKE